MAEVRLALDAMRTRFELVLQGGDASLLRAAGEEALHEIAEAERLLSRFRRDATVARVNREAAARVGAGSSCMKTAASPESDLAAVLVFIDGTICDDRQRHHLMSTPGFHARVFIACCNYCCTVV